jgi:N-dimethylarginine dimethylaminohydrolase
MEMTPAVLSEVDRLTHVMVKHPRDAFVDAPTIAAQWASLNFTAAPDLGRAIDEYERFLELLTSNGIAVTALPRDERTTLDSIYARDASIVSPQGVILCRMGKPSRSNEPSAQEQALRTSGTVAVCGSIEPPGTLEGGDVVWLDARTIIIGRGYRTNAEGIRQVRAMLGHDVDVVVEVPLPHWRGPGDVMHLMSLVSPVDHDLAVVYSPLLPVPFRDWLLGRGLHLVDVPDEEFDSMGTNVLALSPRRCVMLAGNPRTRAALERARCEVLEYRGDEISVKGAGGPTCLTRPLVRSSI